MTIIYFKKFKYVLAKLLYLFILLFIIFTGNNSFGYNVFNNNNVKNITSDNFSSSKKLININNVNDFNKYNDNYLIGFKSHINSYYVEDDYSFSCDSSNNSVYYNDIEFGNIRVFATNKMIPCGSVIKVNDDDVFLGIVLDHRNIANLDINVLSNNDSILYDNATSNFIVMRTGW